MTEQKIRFIGVQIKSFTGEDYREDKQGLLRTELGLGAKFY